MSEETEETQSVEGELVETPTAPAAIIAQVLTQLRDSAEPDEAIASRILIALTEQGYDVNAGV